MHPSAGGERRWYRKSQLNAAVDWNGSRPMALTLLYGVLLMR
jgi:hypothetical protein